MNNFLVTAMGRSGTKFLANIMNKSRIWTVKHEPDGRNDLNNNILQIQKRFNRDYYGEVNVMLGLRADEIITKKKGVILRDPTEIWLSITNRHPKEQWRNDLEYLEKSIIKLIYYSMKKDYKIILFDKMTTSKNYLDETLLYFGIEDVRITNEMLAQKINATKVHKYSSMKEFDSKIQDIVHDLSNKMKIITGGRTFDI